jgi:hypothetical protein
VATELFANNPSTQVTSGGTSAPAGGTVETWTVVSSIQFPSASSSLGTQFHVSDPAQPSELIAVTNVSGTTWTVTRGVESTAPVAHASGFTVFQVVSAGWLSTVATSGAWQFRPEAYGARGDGRVVADVATNGTTTITSASAGFVNATAPAGDVGKYVMINGANGATSGPLLTTIASVTNATTAVLANAASATASNCPMVWGTDDTSAVNSCITAAKNYAVANNYFAEVLFSASIYILGTGPTQTTSPATQNSQIQIPFPAVSGATQKLVIALTGAGPAGHVQYWESTTPNIAGTALVSMTTAPGSPDGTYGNQSVIGGPSGGGAFTGGFANTKVAVTNIDVWCGAYTNQYAFDFAYLTGMYMRQCAAHIFAAPGVGGGRSPLLKDLPADSNFQAAIGVGLRSPVTGNNADVVVDSFCCEGYSRAGYIFDHFTCSRFFTIYNDVVLEIDTSLGIAGVEHRISIDNLGCEQFNGGIRTIGSGGPYVPLAINMDAEVASPAYDISDTGGVLYGWVSWEDTTRTDPTVTGAANLEITNASRGPGVWSGAPAVPATTVAATNTAYRDATVYLTSGGAAVTVIKVDSTTTGLTLGTSGSVTVRVPAGHTITLTYASTAPTWVWVLD